VLGVLSQDGGGQPLRVQTGSTIVLPSFLVFRNGDITRTSTCNNVSASVLSYVMCPIFSFTPLKDGFNLKNDITKSRSVSVESIFINL